MSNIVAIVGRPNVGKSTLFNKLTKSNVLSKNMLFASLDSTIRKSFFNDINVLFIDTVGFIRDLPTTLIDSFKSTLDEIIFSDIILHVRDISNDNYLQHKREVLKILNEIGVCSDDKRIIEVINKVDLIKNHNTHYYKQNKEAIFISATKGSGIDELKNKIKLTLSIDGFSLFKQSN